MSSSIFFEIYECPTNYQTNPRRELLAEDYFQDNTSTEDRVAQIHRKCKRARLRDSPATLNSLPDELIARIIQLACAHYYYYDRDDLESPEPCYTDHLLYALVSRRFRGILLTMPRLWATVTKDMNEKFRELQVERSREYGLDVRFIECKTTEFRTPRRNAKYDCDHCIDFLRWAVRYSLTWRSFIWEHNPAIYCRSVYQLLESYEDQDAGENERDDEEEDIRANARESEGTSDSDAEVISRGEVPMTNESEGSDDDTYNIGAKDAVKDADEKVDEISENVLHTVPDKELDEDTDNSGAKDAVNVPDSYVDENVKNGLHSVPGKESNEDTAYIGATGAKTATDKDLDEDTDNTGGEDAVSVADSDENDDSLPAGDSDVSVFSPAFSNLHLPLLRCLRVEANEFQLQSCTHLFRLNSAVCNSWMMPNLSALFVRRGQTKLRTPETGFKLKAMNFIYNCTDTTSIQENLSFLSGTGSTLEELYIRSAIARRQDHMVDHDPESSMVRDCSSLPIVSLPHLTMLSVDIRDSHYINNAEVCPQFTECFLDRLAIPNVRIISLRFSDRLKGVTEVIPKMLAWAGRKDHVSLRELHLSFGTPTVGDAWEESVHRLLGLAGFGSLCSNKPEWCEKHATCMLSSPPGRVNIEATLKDIMVAKNALIEDAQEGRPADCRFKVFLHRFKYLNLRWPELNHNVQYRFDVN